MLRVIVKIDDFEAYKSILTLLKGVGEKSILTFIGSLTKASGDLNKSDGNDK